MTMHRHSPTSSSPHPARRGPGTAVGGMGLDRVERSVATRMTTPPAASEQNRAVSFDIFLQRFRDGDASSGGREEALRVLMPLLAGPPDGGFGLVRTDDGDAEVYGLNTDGLMYTTPADG